MIQLAPNRGLRRKEAFGARPLEPESQMVRAVFFDFYNTLVHFFPPLDEIQQASSRELGINVAKENIRRGYWYADEYMNKENGLRHISDRTKEERDQFFIEYERILLAGAGVEVSPCLASQIWNLAIGVPKEFVLFDDVVPAFESIKVRGLTIGVISNLRNVEQTLTQLGLNEYVSFSVSSEKEAPAKPHPPIFQEALEKAEVAPSEALHVGDQYQSDVQGATAAGIGAVLLDRDGWYDEVTDVPRISSLPELNDLL